MMTVRLRSHRIARPLDGSGIEYHTPRVKRAMAGGLACAGLFCCDMLLHAYMHVAIKMQPLLVSQAMPKPW